MPQSFNNDSKPLVNLPRLDSIAPMRVSLYNDQEMLAVFDKADKNHDGMLTGDEVSVFNTNKAALEEERNNRPLIRTDALPQPATRQQVARYTKKETPAQQAKHNAREFHDPIYSKTIAGGCDQEGFQAALSRTNADNVVQMLNEYKRISNGNTLFTDIVNEKMDSNTVRSDAVKKIFSALIAKAEASGMDKQNLQTLKAQFNQLAQKEFHSFGIASATELNRIADGLMQGIANANGLTSKEKTQIKSKSNEYQQIAVDLLSARGTKAQKSLQAQHDYDGWAGRTADFVSGLWGSDNRYDKVQTDVQKYQSQVQALKSARAQGPEQFKAKFKETFGINYDPVQVAAYQKNEKTYLAAAREYAKEQVVTDRLGNLSKSDVLREEYTVHTTSYGAAMSSVSATKQDVYNREFNKYAELLGEGDKAKGTKLLNDALAKQGLGKASIDEKYKALSKMAQSTIAQYHKATMKATGNKSFDQISKQYENSYAAAFGTTNDIARRVSNYNASQETGAAVVKGVAVTAVSVVATVATGGAGGAVVTGLISGGASLATDVSDELTSKTRREQLGTEESNKRMAGYVTKAVITGVGSGVSAGVSHAVDGATEGMSALSKAAIGTGADVAVDVGQDAVTQLVTTGEIDGEQLAKTAVTSVVVNTAVRGVQHLLEKSPIDKLADAIDDAVDNTSDADLQTKLEAENVNPAHQRRQYTYQESVDNLVDMNGNRVTIDNVDMNGTKLKQVATLTDEARTPILEVDNSNYTYGNGLRTRTIDIPEADARTLSRKTASLLGNKNSDFADGIESLQARFVAENGGSIEAVLQNGETTLRKSGASRLDAFLDNKRVRDLGLSADLPQDCARMAAGAYSPKASNAAKMNGFEQIGSVTADNGFAAKAFKKGDTVVVAFRGSDDVKDLVVDNDMLSGRLPAQFKNAQDYLAQIKEQYPDAKIVVTGHSLGGSLAELTASADPSVVGVTFDAVGTKGLVLSNEAQGLKDNSNVTAYVVKGDLISNSSAHVGNTTTVGQAINTRASQKVHEQNMYRPFVKHDEHAIGNFTEAKTWQTLSVQEEQLYTSLQRQHPVDTSRPVAERVYTDGSTVRTNVVYPNGSIVNEQLRKLGFKDAPFTPDKEARIVTTTQDMTFVRTLDGENSGVLGSWLMRKSDLEGLTPEQIADKWALPQVPRYMCDVEVPAGTQFRLGECNPLFGKNGGGTQFQLVERIDASHYDNVRRLPKTK